MLRLPAACACALAAVAQAADPGAYDLLDARLAAGTVLASGGGTIAAVGADGSSPTLWTERGRFVARHPLAPPAGGSPAGLALRGELALVAFALGDEARIEAIVLEHGSGRERGRFRVAQYPSRVAAAADGWLVLTREPFAAGSQFLSLDRAGGTADAFTLDREFEAVTARRHFDRNPLGYAGTPVVVGRDLWTVPHGDYELWYPPQHGRGFRRVEPAPCLAAHGRELRGEANAARVLARARGFPEPYRTPLEAAAQAGAVGPTVVSATAGTAAFGSRLAVKVMDDRLATGARLDVWDLASETVLTVLPFAVNDRLLALGDGQAWIVTDGRRLRLVDLGEPPATGGDACAALDAAVAAARAGRDVERVAGGAAH